MRSRALHTLAAAWLAAACTGSGKEDGASAGMGGVAGAMAGAMATPCTPNAVVMCPCVGGGMGTQACNADGKSYAACMGCPAAGGGGTAAALPTPDAGLVASPDAAVDAASDPGTSDGAVGGVAEVGISCGVGLPVLCEVGKEMCCVRSLATDTCVDAEGASCACDVQGCDTLVVRCDGPEDCAAGEVCCGTLGGGGGSTYTAFECVTACDYMGSQREACHVGIDDCPGNNVCANSQLLTNVQVCIDPMTIEQ